MSDLRDLYQDVILEHSKTPRNYRELPAANLYSLNCLGLRAQSIKVGEDIGIAHGLTSFLAQRTFESAQGQRLLVAHVLGQQGLQVMGAPGQPVTRPGPAGSSAR